MGNSITHDFDSFFILCATELVGWSQFADFRGEGKVFLKLLDTDTSFFSLKLKYEGEKLVLAVLDGTRIV